MTGSTLHCLRDTVRDRLTFYQLTAEGQHHRYTAGLRR